MLIPYALGYRRPRISTCKWARNWKPRPEHKKKYIDQSDGGEKEAGDPDSSKWLQVGRVRNNLRPIKAASVRVERHHSGACRKFMIRRKGRRVARLRLRIRERNYRPQGSVISPTSQKRSIISPTGNARNTSNIHIRKSVLLRFWIHNFVSEHRKND